jgi:crotonobetainyl-CoA:carnitine CoA-transferase CaiB-like acyl-CoA transferase
MSVVEALDHPYFKARNMIRTVTDPILGELTIPGFPLKFSEFPELPAIEAPLLGEHGAEVLKQYLGMSEAQVEALRAAAVLFSERK